MEIKWRVTIDGFKATKMIALPVAAVIYLNSFEWLFGTFTPTGGNAPAGTYSFFNAGVFVQIYNPGADLNDPGDDQFDSITLAQTCPGQDAACAFTRDILAAPGGVPEPAAWAMMLAGFGMIGSAMRRRNVRFASA